MVNPRPSPNLLEGVVWYKGFLYQAASWKMARRVVAKVEFHFGERLVKHARYYWLLLAEGHQHRRLFGQMLLADLCAAGVG
jgi:hypothetical protein